MVGCNLRRAAYALPRADIHDKRRSTAVCVLLDNMRERDWLAGVLLL